MTTAYDRANHVASLEINSLTVSYGGIPRARIDTLKVPLGTCVAIVGESGSGKTSILKAVLGLLPRGVAEVAGSARVFGIETVGATSADLRRVRGRRAGLIVQSPIAALNPVLTIEGWARRILREHRIKGAEARALLGRAFDQLGLSHDLFSRYPHQISGGQAQRIVIALALALDTGLILADEPTSALDISHQSDIIEILAGLVNDGTRSALVVSHDLAFVSIIADYVVVMHEGVVVEEGLTGEILTAPTHPYTQRLVAAIPRLSRSGQQVKS